MNILPSRKILIKQIKDLKLTPRFWNNEKKSQETFYVELESGEIYSFTKVWIQGSITEVVNDWKMSNENISEVKDEFTLLTISDGTGYINVFMSKISKEKNMLYDTVFYKGSFYFDNEYSTFIWVFCLVCNTYIYIYI